MIIQLYILIYQVSATLCKVLGIFFKNNLFIDVFRNKNPFETCRQKKSSYKEKVKLYLLLELKLHDKLRHIHPKSMTSRLAGYGHRKRLTIRSTVYLFVHRIVRIHNRVNGSWVKIPRRTYKNDLTYKITLIKVSHTNTKHSKVTLPV